MASKCLNRKELEILLCKANLFTVYDSNKDWRYNNKKHMTISHVLLKYIGVIFKRLYIIHVIKFECDSELNNFIAIFSFLYNFIIPTEIIYRVDIRRCRRC